MQDNASTQCRIDPQNRGCFIKLQTSDTGSVAAHQSGATSWAIAAFEARVLLTHTINSEWARSLRIKISLKRNWACNSEDRQTSSKTQIAVTLVLIKESSTPTHSSQAHSTAWYSHGECVEVHYRGSRTMERFNVPRTYRRGWVGCVDERQRSGFASPRPAAHKWKQRLSTVWRYTSLVGW
jgi:hypothetical protein